MALMKHGATAVVIGGAGTGAGLGQALVHEFAGRGMSVAVVDVEREAAEAVADAVRDDGGEAIAVAADVTDPWTLEVAAAAVGEKLGACNILCAHVGGGGQGRFEHLSLEEWKATLELMVLGTVASVKAFLPLMRKTDGERRIVITSSVAALAPGQRQGPYRAAKAAVTSIGETLAMELEPEGIGVTIVFPSGMLPTELLEFVRSSPDMFDGEIDENDDQMVIGREMTPHPGDLATGSEAAVAAVDGIASGHRYVVTHGVTATEAARRRWELVEAALEAASVRAVGESR